MRTTVAQLMSVDFVTVTVRMSLEDALFLLVDSDTTELCVVDDLGRFEGIVCDFDLLKSQLNNQLAGQIVGSLVSRAVTVLSAERPIEQVIPLFRDGSCSRAYVCQDGRLLGRLSRTSILNHLVSREPASPSIRPILAKPSVDHTTTIDRREATPPAPQFLISSVVSVLGSLGLERPKATSHFTK